MTMKGATGLIIILIMFVDGVVSLAATPCTVISPACDLAFFDVPPIEFAISLDEAVDSTTVDASDFTVNRIKAVSSTVINGNTTIIFHFNRSPAVQGTNIMHIAAGAFNCGFGPVSEFTCKFRFIPSRW